MASAEWEEPKAQSRCGAKRMNIEPPQESPLWMRVLVISESMDEPGCSIEHIGNLLNGIEEGFAEAFDPAEDFPEFAAHRLCRAMRRLLVRLEGQELVKAKLQ